MTRKRNAEIYQDSNSLLKMDRHPEEKKRNQEILVQPTVGKQPEEPLQIPPPEEPLQIPPPEEPLKVRSQEQQQEPIQEPIQGGRKHQRLRKI